ncbi:hypothetical protein BA190_08415 [Labrys sp. WJW]|nr:hypothetical protein BA190_08415 [Labrys sp. WJW]
MTYSQTQLASRLEVPLSAAYIELRCIIGGYRTLVALALEKVKSCQPNYKGSTHHIVLTSLCEGAKAAFG